MREISLPTLRLVGIMEDKFCLCNDIHKEVKCARASLVYKGQVRLKEGQREDEHRFIQ